MPARACTTNAISRRAQGETVRIVAVATGHPSAVHPALHERAVLVDLAVDLPVSVIERGSEERGQMGVHERPAVLIVLGKLAPARVTTSA